MSIGIQDLNWLIPLTNLRVLKLWGEHAVYTDVDALSGPNQTGGNWYWPYTLYEDPPIYNIQGLSEMSEMRICKFPET